LGLAFFLLACFPLNVGARDLNRQRAPLGERASGMGGAFIAMTGDPTSSYYNPAGLAALTRRGLSLSASAYQYTQETYPDAFDLTGRGLPVRSDLESSYFTTFPASIIYVLPISKNQAEHQHVLSFSFLLPMYDRIEARLDTVEAKKPLEVRARLSSESATYWAGPSYAYGIGKLRLGVSLFGLAHLTKSRVSLGERFIPEDPDVQLLERTQVTEDNSTTLSAVAQLGIQYQVSSEIALGLTVRSGHLGTLYNEGSVVWFNSGRSEAANGTVAAYVDRLEIVDLEFTYRQPWMLGLGIAYSTETWCLSLDGRMDGALSADSIVTGDKAMPTNARDAVVTDPRRTLDPNRVFATRAVVNGNLGAEYNFSEKWLGRIGLFTDRSAIDLTQIKDIGVDQPFMFPAIDLYGLSMAVGHRSDLSTTSVGIVTTIGQGQVWRVSRERDGDRTLADARSFSVTLVLSGSTNL